MYTVYTGSLGDTLDGIPTWAHTNTRKLILKQYTYMYMYRSSQSAHTLCAKLFHVLAQQALYTLPRNIIWTKCFTGNIHAIAFMQWQWYHSCQDTHSAINYINPFIRLSTLYWGTICSDPWHSFHMCTILEGECSAFLASGSEPKMIEPNCTTGWWKCQMLAHAHFDDVNFGNAHVSVIRSVCIQVIPYISQNTSHNIRTWTRDW